MAKIKPAAIQPSVSQDAGFPSIPRPRVRRKTFRPTGPKIYQLSKDPEHLGGPGDAPTEFLSAQTTETEWYVYWAFSKLFHDPKDPRLPPYTGARDGSWQYQKFVEGPSDSVIGNLRNVDFIAVFGTQLIGFRIQTARFHVMASSVIQAKDFYLKTHITGVTRLVDIYEQDFIGDPSGEAVCTTLANALRGFESAGPNRMGTAYTIQRKAKKKEPV
jgi:hypothetical protein